MFWHLSWEGISLCSAGKELSIFLEIHLGNATILVCGVVSVLSMSCIFSVSCWFFFLFVDVFLCLSLCWSETRQPDGRERAWRKRDVLQCSAGIF